MRVYVLFVSLILSSCSLVNSLDSYELYDDTDAGLPEYRMSSPDTGAVTDTDTQTIPTQGMTDTGSTESMTAPVADGDADSDGDTDTGGDADTDADSHTEPDPNTDTDSIADTDTNTGMDVDSNTDSDTNADTGNACGGCPAHSECRGTECVCLNHWTGELCNECPGSWDPSQDCNACLPGWSGETCEESCVRHVDIQAEAGGDGLSWSTAYRAISDALSAAMDHGNCAVWVRQGTYYVYETAPSDTLQLGANIPLYGGFEGDETTLDERNPALYPTILDGTDGNSDTNKVHHVVTGAHLALLDGFVIRNGNAKGEDFLDDTVGNGGGLLLVYAAMTVNNCDFIQNRANLYGGAIYALYADLTISNTILEFNSADEGGGALYSAYTTLNAGAMHFDQNQSVSGGALFVARDGGSRSRISDSRFTNNQVDDFLGSGGGVHMEFANELQIVDCAFVGNRALDGASGGGIYSMYSSADITRCTFRSNLVDEDSGGGIYLAYDSTSVISECVFADNVVLSTGRGGGMFIGYPGAIPTVTGCTFSNNESLGIWGSGGGLLVGYGASPLIEKCAFTGNRSLDGGAIGSFSAEDYESVMRVENCVFVGNTAGNGGGFFSSSLTNSTVMNCTFYQNEAENSGGSIMAESSSAITLTNDILTGSAAEEYVKGGSDQPAFIEYNLIDDWTGSGDTNIAGFPTFATAPSVGDGWDLVEFDEDSFMTALEDSSLNLDPGEMQERYVNPSNGIHEWYLVADHTDRVLYVWGDITDRVAAGDSYQLADLHLASSSLGIDAAASQDAPSDDFEGNPRVDDLQTQNSGYGGGSGPAYYDMGAFEFTR